MEYEEKKSRTILADGICFTLLTSVSLKKKKQNLAAEKKKEKKKSLLLTKYADITVCNRNNRKGRLLPSAFLPDSKSNRVFVINSTQLDFEIKVGEFEEVNH